MPPKKGKDDKKEDAPQEVLEETGTFIFADQNAKYSGQVIRRDGHLLRHGAGTFVDDAIDYEGGWKEDVMHGEGTLKFKGDGSSYKGSFVEGQFDGTGVYSWPSGARYDGQWRMNRMHGDGHYTDEDGVLWTGKYYNGTGPGLRRATTVQ